jgi:DNA polymerase III delta prime subunit
MWAEKHTPKSIHDLIIHFPYISEIHSLLKTNNHVLFNGICGIGKTTTTKLALSDMNVSDSNIFTLCASLEKPIDSLSCFLKILTIDRKYVIVKNILSTTKGMQNRIANYIDYKKNVTFIFLVECVDIHSIIESIQSRCICVTFPITDNKSNINFLKNVLINDGVPLDQNTDPVLNYLITHIPFDIRKQLLTLGVLYNFGDQVEPITMIRVKSLIHKSHIEVVNEYLNLISQKNHERANDVLQNVVNSGVEHTDLTHYLLTRLTDMDSCTKKSFGINNDCLGEYIRVIGDTQVLFTRGITTELQLEYMTMRICGL